MVLPPTCTCSCFPDKLSSIYLKRRGKNLAILVIFCWMLEFLIFQHHSPCLLNYCILFFILLFIMLCFKFDKWSKYFLVLEYIYSISTLDFWCQYLDNEMQITFSVKSDKKFYWSVLATALILISSFPSII